MKKILTTAALSALACLPALSQEAGSTITYSLPRTALCLEVSVDVNAFVAGPLAAYSEECIGVEAPTEDYVRYNISSVELKTVVEADPSATRSVIPAGLDSKLLNLTPQGYVSGAKLSDEMPMSQGCRTFDFQDLVDSYNADLLKVSYPDDFIGSSSDHEKASAIASRIETIKTLRRDLVTGDTVGDLYGEATSGSLRFLKEEEQGLTKLFTGKKGKTVTLKYRFFVVPGANAQFSAPLFRFDEENGVLSVKDKSGTVVSVSLKGEVPSSPSAATRDPQTLSYRIPAIATANVVIGSQTIFSTRIPVYQMGIESSVPVSTKNK